MKLLVLGGSHGPPEKTGLQLVESLERSPIPNVKAEIANSLAVQLGVRYSKHNLSVSFPGDIESPDYELMRAAELIQISQSYDVVLDIHDRPEATGEYVLLSRESQHRLLGVAALLNINRCIIVEEGAGCMVNHVPHAMTIEFARGNGREQIDRNVQKIRQCLSMLAVSKYLADYDSSATDFYKDILEIRGDQAIELGLQRYANIAPFGQLPDAAVRRLGLVEDGSYYAEYWSGSSSSEGEYFGGVLQVIDNPFAVTGE